MSEAELEILLMGYLDGELDDEQRRKVAAALEEDEDLRRELAEMTQLRRLTRAASSDHDMDSEIGRFWGAIYNRTERQIAWVLLLAGLLILIAGVLLRLFRNGDVPLGLRISGGCALAGFLLLFCSVLRKRLRTMRHDRYSREVHR